MKIFVDILYKSNKSWIIQLSDDTALTVLYPYRHHRPCGPPGFPRWSCFRPEWHTRTETGCCSWVFLCLLLGKAKPVNKTPAQRKYIPYNFRHNTPFLKRYKNCIPQKDSTKNYTIISEHFFFQLWLKRDVHTTRPREKYSLYSEILWCTQLCQKKKCLLDDFPQLLPLVISWFVKMRERTVIGNVNFRCSIICNITKKLWQLPLPLFSSCNNPSNHLQLFLTSLQQFVSKNV